MSHFIYCYAECRYAECRYAECRGAYDTFTKQASLTIVAYDRQNICTVQATSSHQCFA